MDLQMVHVPAAMKKQKNKMDLLYVFYTHDFGSNF